jgi:choline dehydrogenase-like flavoprotein
MIYDYADQQPVPGQYDVCIVGAGPAGICLANKLDVYGKKVLLLEAGGLTYSQQSQDLYECDTTGRDLWPETTRLRYLGGTSNHWAGRCRPFDPSDFSEGHYSGASTWPISFDELDIYLKEAMEILDISSSGFQTYNDDLDREYFVADHYALSTPTRFSEKYLDSLRESQNIDLFINANAVFLESVNDQINSIQVKNYNGLENNYSSKQFVLAMGAIENARFLLNQSIYKNEDSRKAQKNIGKYLMEHFNVKIGEFILADTDDTSSYQFYTTDALCAENQIGKSNFSFGTVQEIKSYGRTAEIKTFFKNLACGGGFSDKVQFIERFECPGTGIITTLMEQAPGSQSYISLSNETDALGLKKAVVHWEINDTDQRMIKASSLELARVFSDSGMGAIKLEDYILDDSIMIPISPHAHHMGTTRMSSKPEDGVVDGNSCIFGMENLYVAGSSVFATGGGCNPTLPIVQLSLRLADHLRRVD